MSMPLRLHLLGTPVVKLNDTPVAITANKALAILAYLAISPVPQRREKILALLWPDSASDAARKNLRNILWSLRREIGATELSVDGDDLSLAPSVWVDVRELERYAEQQPADDTFISTLEYGLFVDGINVHDAPDFELWLSTQRERIAQLYLRAIQQTITRLRHRRDWHGVVRYAEKGLACDNLHEPLHRDLMEAYARLGQRGDALRQYDILSRALDSELGIEPLPETQVIRDGIIKGLYDIPQELPSVDSPAVRPLRRQSILGTPPPVRFVGRSRELSQLTDVYHLTLSGKSCVALITGELGIGKSRLWQEWSSSVPPTETTLLQMRGLESMQSLPFAPLVELVSSSACLRKVIETPAGLARNWLTEIARVVPAVRAALPDIQPPMPLPFEEERSRLFEAFCQFILALKAEPLVLFVDDAHWIDQTMLNWLAYLVHRCHDQHLMLVLAYREEDATPALSRTIAGWGREGLLQRIPLLRLTENEAYQLVQALDDSTGSVKEWIIQSAGNPYFLIELCRNALPEVPRELSDLIRARLNRLTTSTRQILQAASILVPGFDYMTLRRTSGRGEEETLNAIDEMLDTAIITDNAGYYTFSHPLVATVVRAALSNARVTFLHRRAAEAIIASYGSHADEFSSQLAEHFAGAGDYALAAHYADIAAQRALGLAAPAEAVEFYRKALQYESTPARQMNLARCLQYMSELAAAQAAFEQAYRSYVELGDARNAAAACLDIASLNLGRGRIGDVRHWINESNRFIDANADPESQAMAWFILAMGYVSGGESLADAEAHFRLSIEIALQHGLMRIAGGSAFNLGNLLARRGQLDGALAFYRDALQYASESGDVIRQILARNNIAYHSILAGALNTAREFIESALELAETTAMQMPLQYLYSTRGEVALAEQQWDVAESWFKRGMREAEKAGNSEQIAGYLANLSHVCTARGDLDGADRLLSAAMTQADQLSVPFLSAQLKLMFLRLCMLRGETDKGEELLQRLQSQPALGEFKRLSAELDQIQQELSARKMRA